MRQQELRPEEAIITYEAEKMIGEDGYRGSHDQWARDNYANSEVYRGHPKPETLRHYHFRDNRVSNEAYPWHELHDSLEAVTENPRTASLSFGKLVHRIAHDYVHGVDRESVATLG